MKIVVTGGTGFIGRALVRSLAQKGHQCTVLVRSMPDHFPEEVRFVPYSDLPEIRKCDAVINLAGESVVGRWTPEKKERILHSRVGTTHRLVDWMAHLNTRPEVFLSGSAVGIYGHRPGEALPEDASLDPEQRFRYRVCEAWEQEAHRATQLGIRTVLLRTGAVLDEGGGFYGLLVPWLRRAPFFLRLAPKTMLPWIALHDTVRMIEFALKEASIEGPLNVVGPNTVTLGRFTDLLAKRFHRPVLGRVPDPFLSGLFGEFACTFLDSQDVRPAKALQHGFEFEHREVSALLNRRGSNEG